MTPDEAIDFVVQQFIRVSSIYVPGTLACLQPALLSCGPLPDTRPELPLPTAWRPQATALVVSELPEIWDLIQKCWSSDQRKRPTFEAICLILTTLKPSIQSNTPSSSISWNASGLRSTNQAKGVAVEWQRGSTKKYTAFLSHHKESCAAEARIIKEKLEATFDGAPAFLGKLHQRKLRHARHVCQLTRTLRAHPSPS